MHKRNLINLYYIGHCSISEVYFTHKQAFLHAVFLLNLLFKPKDGSDIFLRNIGCLSSNCRALYEDVYIISGACAGSCTAVVVERGNDKW
jgi:hypothetical protein